MDRQAIERRDFPIARRGYEIEAVDAHLATLADECEGLARRGRTDSPGGLGAVAAEQVRMIVEAAEQSAEDIGREAELEVRQLRQDAREEAERARADFAADASAGGSPDAGSAEAGSEPDSGHAAVPDSAAVDSVLPALTDSEDGLVAGEDRQPAESEGARMVALNMALNGVPRAETRVHLEQNFAVGGLDELLDDAYDRAGK